MRSNVRELSHDRLITSSCLFFSFIFFLCPTLIQLTNGAENLLLFMSFFCSASAVGLLIYCSEEEEIVSSERRLKKEIRLSELEGQGTLQIARTSALYQAETARQVALIAGTNGATRSPVPAGAEEPEGAAPLREHLRRALSSLDAPVGVGEVMKAPSFVRCELIVPPALRFNKLEQAARDLEIQMGLPGLPLFGVIDGMPYVDLPLHDRDRTFYELEDEYCDGRVALGVDATGNVVHIDLDDPNYPHFLGAGQTGSGKSAMACTIIESLLRAPIDKQAAVSVVDLKRTQIIQPYLDDERLQPIQLAGAGGRPSGVTARVATSYDMAMQFVSRFDAELTRRVEGGLYSERRWVLVIDELHDLLLIDAQEKDLEGNKAPLTRMLDRLARQAREYRLTLFILTHRPTGSTASDPGIPIQLRTNLPVRLAMNCRDNGAATALGVAGIPGVDIAKLSGKGDMYLVDPGGNAKRIQVFHSSPAPTNGAGDPIDINVAYEQVIDWIIEQHQAGEDPTQQQAIQLFESITGQSLSEEGKVLQGQIITQKLKDRANNAGRDDQ